MITDQQGTITTSVSSTTDPPELVMERIYDAPRELVFRAWTDPKHVAQWWGPNGWTLPVCEIELRVGGVWHYCMRGADGEESCGRAVYREITEPERLVFTDAFADSAGRVDESMPEMQITLTLEALGDKTKATSRTRFASVEDLEATLAMGVVQGATESMDRLEAELARMSG